MSDKRTHINNGAIGQAIERGRIMREEIAFLRSFHWNDKQIAMRLGIDVKTVQKHDQRRKNGLYPDE